MSGSDLGYMGYEEWKQLTSEQRDYYLWNAVAKRCETCGAVKGIWGKIFFPSLVLIGSIIGGLIAQKIGLETAVHLIPK